jgi:sugar-specific transcriptional regulator TrmB
MEIQALEDIGLSKGEVTIYITLLEIGPSSAGPILKKAHIQNSVLHFNLNNLIRKGLISYIKKGKRRIYQAINPELILDYVENKKEEIRKILPDLIEKQNKIIDKEEVEIFEEIKGIKTALNLLIEDTKPKEEFLFFSADQEEDNKEIQKFYESYDAKRKEKKLITKGIAPKNLEKLFKKRRYLHMKYINFPIPENMGLCGNKIAIISWGKQPRAILINSKIIALKQKKFFNAIWTRDQ